MADMALAGLRVMLVEDDWHVAQATAIGLRIMGAEVLGPYGDVEGALAAAMSARIDAAVLDVQLVGTLVYRVADVLTARGIPFLFATAYSHDRIPVTYRDVPHWEKPYSLPSMLRILPGLCRATA